MGTTEMMSGMMFALIAAVATLFFVDILHFVFRTLSNFLRRAKIKKIQIHIMKSSQRCSKIWSRGASLN